MLYVSNLSKRYGDNLLFEKVHFVINEEQRVGLVGANGCGKTTLMRILVGKEAPTEGSVRCEVARARVGYLSQALSYTAETTVQDLLRGGQRHDQDYWADHLEAVARKMASAEGEALSSLEKDYADALEHLNQAARQIPDHRIREVLAGLDLESVEPETPVDILSGGQKTRLGLARLLVQNPALLLLDEPTNHLDITALEWLEAYLSDYRGAMLIVSHDRTFLDHTVTHILEMEERTCTVREYVGTYTDYVRQKERERRNRWQEYKQQQQRIEDLQSAIKGLGGHAGRIEGETIDFHYRKKAKRLARQATVQRKRLERLLESEERVEKPKAGWQMNLDFLNTPPSGQDVLILDGVSKRYGDRLLFRDTHLLLSQGERVVLVGANGTGKTTLLRMIVGQEKATEGRIKIGANVRVGYLSQEQENLDGDKTPLETVRHAAPMSETEARSFLHYFLFAGDDVFVPVERLSHGERARLRLGVLVLQDCNLLLLDEPINHLDIPSRENFEQALSAYDGTVLAVVHDRYFIKRFPTAIWSIENQRVRRYVNLKDMHRDRG
ncbi:MAG: ribosomal protection-like ABC-F family protein [Anaerolineales bacterium]